MSAALVLALVLAHPQGFHKRVTLELWSTSVDALVVMDVDGGERCELLRAGADANHDGVLDPKETTALKKKLTTLATRALKLSISTWPVPLAVKEAKLSLKEDPRVGPGGLSVAVLLTARHPHAVTPGMSLTVEDAAPDGSEVEVQVFQHPAPDAGMEPPVKAPVVAGQPLKVRMGALVSH